MKGKFKHTEIGWIPEDWEVKKLGEVFNITAGGDFKKSQSSNYKNEKFVYPIYSNSLSNNGLYGYANYYTNEAGAITITARGTIGKAKYRDHKFTAIGRVLVLNPKNDIDGFYISEFINNRIKFILEVTGVPQLTAPQVSKYHVVLPPLPEQRAIAQVLSDTDALIEKLEQLIAKKRNIKTAAMQQLLKPKEGWKYTTVEKLGKPYGGLSGKSKVDFKDGNCPYIPFMNVLNNPIIDTSYLEFVKIKAGENQHKAEKGDLFFNGSSETPEEVGMCSILLEDIPNLYLNSFCFGFRLFKEEKNDGLYLSYFFRSSYCRKIFYNLAQGATRHNLSKSNFLKIEIQIPKPEEQIKIATIIRDMDKEIEALEKQLEKYKMLKQGMMQVLLTGKVRLIENGELRMVNCE
jgi:type I restriction enzyme S subunit